MRMRQSDIKTLAFEYEFSFSMWEYLLCADKKNLTISAYLMMINGQLNPYFKIVLFYSIHNCKLHPLFISCLVQNQYSCKYFLSVLNVLCCVVLCCVMLCLYELKPTTLDSNIIFEFLDGRFSSS